MLKYFPQPETDPQKFLAKNLEHLMKEWVWHVYDYLRMSKDLDIHFTFFEGFNTNFQKELEHLLDYLEVNLSSTQKASIEEEVAFARLKKENPKHLCNGKSGYWREQLSPGQAEWATAYTRPLLQLLGYLEDGFQNEGFNHRIARTNFEALKNNLIEAQQPAPLPNP